MDALSIPSALHHLLTGHKRTPSPTAASFIGRRRISPPARAVSGAPGDL